MAALTVVQTLWATQLPVLGQSALLDVLDGGTPTLVIRDPGRGEQASLALGPGLLSPGAAQIRSMPQGRELRIDGQDRRLDGGVIDRLAQGDTSGQAYLDGVGFAGNLVALHRTVIGGSTLLYVTPSLGQGVSSYRIGGDGQLTLLRALGDSQTRYLDGVTALDSVYLGGRHLLVTISQREHGLSVFSLTGGGQLNAVGSYGLADQLPVERPTAMDLVETAEGRVFVLLAAFGSGSLTVLELQADGRLLFVDQVLDTRDTRFATPVALDVITVEDRTLIAIAGGEAGLSLFQMLPGGRLVHRETLTDTAQTALDGVRQLRFVERGDEVELFALSSRDAGLTRLVLDLGPAGRVGEDLFGTGEADILTAPEGGARVRARNGDDILIDGSGADTLWGGTDADLFVFRPDNRPDIIADFNLTEDRIDLSGFLLWHDIDEITITPVSGGVRLTWGRESLDVLSDTGAAIPVDAITARLLFNSDRVILPDPLPTVGNSSDDQFTWSTGADTIDGGAGVDMMIYTASPDPAVADLGNSANNAGAAAGDVLRNIEGLTGTRRNDRLTGDGNGNTLVGLQGSDTLLGGDGFDWITPGKGADSVDGGGGTDMVSFSDLAHPVRVDLVAGTAISNSDTDTLIGIEQVTGTVHGDYLQGDAGDNRIRGLGDYDWLVGSEGHDVYDGGTGRDMVSYVNSATGVAVHLGVGRGTRGQAEGDTYVSIERLTGSIYEDLFNGSGGEDDFRGLGGYDWFIGSSGGKDRYDGGSGKDTVAYSSSSAGVTASLLLGRGSAGDAARDLYTSIENLTGTSYADRLTGDNGRNVLRGLYGEDVLIGNGGVDRLEGGGSNDTLDGGSGWDYAIYSGNRAEYTVTTSGATTTVDRIAPGGEGTDTLTNIEALQFADGFLFL